MILQALIAAWLGVAFLACRGGPPVAPLKRPPFIRRRRRREK